MTAAALLFWSFSPDAKARLSLTSEPANAVVLLEGHDTGKRTPTVLLLDVRRDHWVTLRHAEAGEARRRFHFQRKGSYTHQFVLPGLKEALTVESKPAAADLLVQGELRGQTPLTLRLALGKKHVVELHKSGFRPKRIQHYSEQRQSRLRIELEPDPRPTRRMHQASVKRAPPAAGPTRPAHAATGIFEVATNTRARVFINGRFVGRTPNFRRALPAGSYKVVVSPEGVRIRHEATIRVMAHQIHRFTLTAPDPE